MLKCVCRRAVGGLFTGVVLLVFPALLQADSLENRIYLSAGAPWGEPGARATLAVACDDTVGRDTLYLSFEPARDDTGFVAVQGEIHFYAQAADTLGRFWAMERGAANNGGLVAQFGPDATFPQPQPWTTQGVGSVTFDRTAHSARLRFIFAVPIDHPSLVRAGTRYVLGRLLLGAKRSRLDGCDRPVCVEWHSAALSYKGRRTEAVKRGGSRWLSLAGDAADCRERIPAWRPKKTGGGTSVPPPGSAR